MLASRNSRTNIVHLLLEHGADANLENKVAKSVCVSVCLTAVYWAYNTTITVLQVASARFARFSYCGHGFARYTRFTSYGNPVCMIEVVKLNT